MSNKILIIDNDSRNRGALEVLLDACRGGGDPEHRFVAAGSAVEGAVYATMDEFKLIVVKHELVPGRNSAFDLFGIIRNKFEEKTRRAEERNKRADETDADDEAGKADEAGKVDEKSKSKSRDALFQGARDMLREPNKLKARGFPQSRLLHWSPFSLNSLTPVICVSVAADHQFEGLKGLCGRYEKVFALRKVAGPDKEFGGALKALYEKLVKKRREQEAKSGSEREGAAWSHFTGASKAYNKMLDYLSKAALTDKPILLTGESGVGKEILARLIRDLSWRRHSDIYSLNCAGIPRDMIENEFFGHVKGAYTGATDDYEGIMMAADFGTIFLDEIGETDPAFQAKLLRAIEYHEVQVIGREAKDRPKSYARFVAATNRDLRAEIESKSFRLDLFHRFPYIIDVPPLRERAEDLPDLIRHLLSVQPWGPAGDEPWASVTDEAMRRLCAYHWPGNVRELKNVLDIAHLMSDGREIGVDHLPDHVLRSSGARRAAAAGAGAAGAEEALFDNLPRLRELLEKYDELGLMPANFLPTKVPAPAGGWPDDPVEARLEYYQGLPLLKRHEMQALLEGRVQLHLVPDQKFTWIQAGVVIGVTPATVKSNLVEHGLLDPSDTSDDVAVKKKTSGKRKAASAAAGGGGDGGPSREDDGGEGDGDGSREDDDEVPYRDDGGEEASDAPSGSGGGAEEPDPPPA